MLKLRIERVRTIDLPPDPTLNPRVEVWRDNEGLIAAYGETLGEECRMHLPGLASFRCHRCLSAEGAADGAPG